MGICVRLDHGELWKQDGEGEEWSSVLKQSLHGENGTMISLCFRKKQKDWLIGSDIHIDNAQRYI